MILCALPCVCFLLITSVSPKFCFLPSQANLKSIHIQANTPLKPDFHYPYIPIVIS